MIKPNYATQDLVTKLKLSKGKTTLGIQLLKKLERTSMVSNKGLRLKVLSRVLITCFSCVFGSQHKDDEFFSILGWRERLQDLCFVTALSHQKVVNVTYIGCLDFVQMRIHNLTI